MDEITNLTKMLKFKDKNEKTINPKVPNLI